MNENNTTLQLNGQEKAVLFLLGLDKDVASVVMSHLEDKEVRQLADALPLLRDRSSESLVRVYQEFLQEIKKPRLTSPPGIDYFKNLAVSAIGEERVNKIFDGESTQSKACELLSQLDPRTSAEILSREHPQAVATILYQLDDLVAGEIVKRMPEDTMQDVLTRMAALVSVSPDAVREVESMLSSVIGEPSSRSQKLDGVVKTATMMNLLDPDLANQILDKIAEEDNDLAEGIRRERFTIEDLGRADARGLQTVLKEVSTEQLVFALKTASEETKEKFFSCLSSRAAEMLKEEMQMLGAVRLKEVEKSQREIVEIAMRLQKEGKLTVAGQAGEKFV